MSRRNDPPPQASPAPTTDQIRDRIDSGETGDKVDHPDPAAAPLGTDDEAAGTPPGRVRRQPEQPARPAKDGSSNRWIVFVVLSVLLVLLIGGGVLLQQG